MLRAQAATGLDTFQLAGLFNGGNTMMDLDGAAAQELFEGFAEFEDRTVKRQRKMHRAKQGSWLRRLWRRMTMSSKPAGQGWARVDSSSGGEVRRVRVLVGS